MPNHILSIETGGSRFSIAVICDGKVIAQLTATDDLMHESKLGPSVLNLLAENQLVVSDLASIAAGSGPGSYSGLRTGMAFASGLSMATGIPLIPVGTLENIVHQLQNLHPNADFYVVMLKARQQESFLGIWSGWNEYFMPCWISDEAAAKVLGDLPPFNLMVTNSDAILNDEAMSRKGKIIPEYAAADAKTVGLIAFQRLPSFLNSGIQEVIEPAYLKPVYISSPGRD
jgi:tRNA threonylcarbamoyl adenosine modification protein YeaZ